MAMAWRGEGELGKKKEVDRKSERGLKGEKESDGREEGGQRRMMQRTNEC